MFEGKRGLKIAIYVKGFSEKEKRLFPDKDQMKICKEFIHSQTKGVLVKEYYDNYTKGGCQRRAIFAIQEVRTKSWTRYSH